MRRTSATAGVLVTAALSLGLSGTAHAQDLDCSDFATQPEAQAVFNQDLNDPNNLDADNDGIACEALSGGMAEDNTPLGGNQVSTQPQGAVAAGDGSTAQQSGSTLPYVIGGVALTGAAGAAFAARRASRPTA